jgi:hypothetical protein
LHSHKDNDPRQDFECQLKTLICATLFNHHFNLYNALGEHRKGCADLRRMIVFQPRSGTSPPIGRNAPAAIPHGIFALGPVPLIAPSLVVGLGLPRRKHLPCLREVGAGLVEGRRDAAEIFARLRTRIEAAPLAPPVPVVRDAGSDRRHADMDVAAIDQPAFFASVVVAAAGKFGHAAIEALADGRVDSCPCPL